MKILKQFLTWLGLQLLIKHRALISEELKWALCKYKIERLPNDSSIYATIRFNLSINNYLISLLELRYSIISITKHIDINNGDLIVTIAYIDEHTMANIINWAANNLQSASGSTVKQFMELKNGNTSINST